MNNVWQITHRIQNHVALPKEERRLFVKAMILSAWIRFVTLWVPMKWWHKAFLGDPVRECDHSMERQMKPGEEIIIKKIRRATGRCKRNAPWKVTCLVEAVMQRKFLRAYGLNKAIHILVQQKNGALQAHAYVHGDADHLQNKGVGQSNFSFC
jgi:hypothetical protein